MLINIDILEIALKWPECHQHAKERGALALELFVAQSTPANGPEDVKASLPAHLAYRAQLEENWTLAFAGPMSDNTGELMQGMGMIIYRAETMDAARALAEADPMHQSGARTFTLRRGMINEGSLSSPVGLSKKNVSLS